MENDRAGFDPWLVLFVTLVGGFLPLLYIYSWVEGLRATFAMAAAYGRDAPPYAVILQSSFSYVVRLGLCGFILWRMLWVRTPRTPLICAIALGALLIGVPLLEILVSSLFAPVPGDLLFRWAAPVLSRGCFFAFAGAWFLLKSRAVEQVYGDASEAREIFD
jgi:hypothetical protein